MYNTGSNTVTSGHSATFSESPDTKQTVAELLSSLSSGEYAPAYSGVSASPYNNLTGTTQAVSTPILTPNTLVTLEQAFSQVQQVQPAYTASTQIQQNTRESGFVPPVVSQPVMVKQEYSDYGYSQDSFGDDTSDSEWMQPSAKRSRLGTPPAAHSHHNNQLQRQMVLQPAHNVTYTASVGAPSTARRTPGPRRHIRNEMLPPEDEEKRSLRRERNKVAAAKCRQRRVDLTNQLLEESDGLEDERSTLETEIQSLQHQKEQLEFLLEAHKPVCSNRDRVESVPSTSGVDAFLPATAIKSEPSGPVLSRPTSLPLRTSVNVTASIGVPVTTPSNGVNVFNVLGLDSLIDGHTGLTPLTGTPSCSSQVQRNSSDSSPNDTLASPTTLMAL